MTKARSEEREARDRSGIPAEGGGVCVVLPWPRASIERTPPEGVIARNSLVKAAKERPDEPAPWCVTMRGPEGLGGVK